MNHPEDPFSFLVTPGGTLRGRLRVPGDKSISHRAVILGAIAEGETRISGFLEGEDTLATLAAFRDMGVTIEVEKGGEVRIQGVGLRGLSAPSGPLYLGNSGTSMRLLSGVLAGQSFVSELTGDPSLSRRPMGRVADPLNAMGADIATANDGRPPVRIRGGKALSGIDYAIPVASAQVKSCLLLAGLFATGRTCVQEPAPTRDHTERMLVGFGYPVEWTSNGVCIEGGNKLQGTQIVIPGDISSAAFFLVGASIAPGSDLILEGVGVNPTRTGIISILRRMGAEITLSNQRTVGGELMADLQVRSQPLHGIEIPPDMVPLAIDEFPALFIAAAFAEGETTVTGAEELRNKESDRIATMAKGLEKLGIDAKPTTDGMIIRGGAPIGGRVASYGDHRIAMAFAVAGIGSRRPIFIEDCASVATSFPSFPEVASEVGLRIVADKEGSF